MPEDYPRQVNFGDLTPLQVLDALDAVGLHGDGRILQLNSYENRVFQVMLEQGDAVVAKFYRPGRWSDAQILEEHAFALELAETEVPVVPPLVLQGTHGPTAAVLRGLPPTLACLPVAVPGPGTASRLPHAAQGVSLNWTIPACCGRSAASSAACTPWAAGGLSSTAMC